MTGSASPGVGGRGGGSGDAHRNAAAASLAADLFSGLGSGADDAAAVFARVVVVVGGGSFFGPFAWTPVSTADVTPDLLVSSLFFLFCTTARSP